MDPEPACPPPRVRIVPLVEPEIVVLLALVPKNGLDPPAALPSTSIFVTPVGTVNVYGPGTVPLTVIPLALTLDLLKKADAFTPLDDPPEGVCHVISSRRNFAPLGVPVAIPAVSGARVGTLINYPVTTQRRALLAGATVNTRVQVLVELFCVSTRT